MIDDILKDIASSCVDYYPEGDSHDSCQRTIEVALRKVLAEVRSHALGDENMNTTVLDYADAYKTQGPHLAMRTTIEEMLDRIGVEEEG